MTHTVAVVQARMGSTRLKGKVLKPLAGSPAMLHVVAAAQSARGIDEVWVATSTLDADDVIFDLCRKYDIPCFRGSEVDVLERFLGTAEASDADILIRLTADCVFLDSEVISQVVKLREMTGADYASNVAPPTYADGMDVEVFTVDALKRADNLAVRGTDRDCVTSVIRRNKHIFKCENLVSPLPGLHKERWVLDSPEDYQFCLKLMEKLTDAHAIHSHIAILSALDKNPELRQINAKYSRNERTYETMVDEQRPEPSYENSRRLLARAEAVIPLAAQTFSKSKIQFPGRSPLFLTHGEGGIAYDVDGNEYVDLISALLPNILGYCDPDVDEAIRRQLNRGISFSLATELETELAELLQKHIPCAEMVRFGKNGTDVTSAAIRLARAYTNRGDILSSGYHGWADWSVCNDTLRGRGAALSPTYTLKHGDIETATYFLSQKRAAAVIVEPESDPKFLSALRSLCDQYGTVLIFDEVITGFRFSLGGAQALFRVQPDLACFGKAMANGMPLSAIVGKREIMKLMAPPDNIFYSGTFFGETLSLAASIATINKLVKTDALTAIAKLGDKLQDDVITLHRGLDLDGVLVFAGHPSLVRLSFNGAGRFNSEQIRSLFIQEMARNGVLIIGSHNLCYAHTQGSYAYKRIMRAYEKTLTVIADGIHNDDLDKHISGVIEAKPVRAA